MRLLIAVLAFATVAFANAMPAVKTVWVIVLENRNWSDIEGSPDAPYINQVLLPSASYCREYYNPPLNHPSIRNYLWLEAGTDFGVTFGSTPNILHQSTTNHLLTQLRAAGISWKFYQEDIDGLQVPLDNVNGYAVRHNPAVYFDDVTGTNNPYDAYGISHIRPYSEMAADLAKNTMARYNFITPNLCDDGHDICMPLANSVAQTDNWLSTEIPKILASQAYTNNGAIFIVWDEGVDGDGPIGMILLSPLARGGGYFNHIHYTHSSLLRSVQEIFGVGPLLNDAVNATDLSDLFTSFSITSATMLTNGFQVTIAGVVPGRSNVVETSTNFSAWTPVCTNVSTTNTITILDSGATDSSQRFYRVREVR
jgi:phosphatidylinositol-3-phosphatase